MSMQVRRKMPASNDPGSIRYFSEREILQQSGKLPLERQANRRCAHAQGGDGDVHAARNHEVDLSGLSFANIIPAGSG
jgi:hypothetical protein